MSLPNTNDKQYIMSMCVYFERSDELCYRMFVETDHSHNRIIPPPCPVTQRYTRDRAHICQRKQLGRRKEGTEIVGSVTLLPNIGAECVIMTIRASLPYHWVHRELTMEHS